MQLGMLALTALSHLCLDAMISQGPALGKGTQLITPNLAGGQQASSQPYCDLAGAMP